MPETDDVRPRLTAVLRAYLALGPDEELIVDEDGDVPIRYESAMYFVRLLERDPPLVQVFSHVLRDVPDGATVLGNPARVVKPAGAGYGGASVPLA